MTSSEQETQVLTLQEPTPEAARETIAAGFDREALVTVFGRCTVDYDGRATSRLEAGERHVMFKPDGAALVHTDEGQQPVNWQPPGCDHEVFLEDEDGSEDGAEASGDAGDGNALCMRSLRSTPEERLLITFEHIMQVSTFTVTDPSELSLSGTEADLKARILDEPALLEPGFTPLATERETPAGAVDIYGEDADGRTVVVELKRRRVGPDAVGQLRRYIDALERDLHADAAIRGVLVAPSVTERAKRLLERDGLEFVALEPTAES
ncbi:endonuclease NucS [Halobacteria archaeon AArc-m2/3/4]|uniref:Endonuclease NucS n=1 Tax=Natronoglomus mannanivorans TaxID=2979990 RepID=A0ABT2QDX8_9EURY|nr:endonuclease NucS [Halobacteria archaeon AArc-m2/3/4]